mmetsp:Transcript_33791/g.107306  ORF Transcript_33791/g.107306 Transcript_33791/m.107306 type:complete len:340 (+) Transcript_33791:201-1220(+)
MDDNFYMQRVKVYRLNESGSWDDKGTGHVSVEYMEQSDAVGLVVISEEDTSTLLIHRISREDIYQRQGSDTIISWADSEIGTDIALSFQQQLGCNYIWEQIGTVQTQYNSSPRAAEMAARRKFVDEYEHTLGEGSEGEGRQDGIVAVPEVPTPEMGNIAEIAKVVMECSPFQRDKLALQVLRPGFIPALLELFRTIEDVEDAEGLANMYRVVRGIVLLNDTAILDVLLREEHVMDVVGALEYDPELPERQAHRAFLRDSVVFKEVVPITDPLVLTRIHQTYRIGYLKDVILPRVLDEATFGTLSSLILQQRRGGDGAAGGPALHPGALPAAQGPRAGQP